MDITRFVATPDGGSRFEDMEIRCDNTRVDADGHTIRYSTPYSSPAVCIVELPAGLDQNWHQAPARQLVVVLSGTIEVRTTDDAVRRWHAGDAFIPSDVSGRGHRTRAVDGPVRLLFAPLPAGFSIASWQPD